MRTARLLVWLVVALVAGGCSFNRADFVCGSNGKADDGQMSDSGRTLGDILRHGPHLTLNY
jgi:hypothetical protein